jgi:RNA polymerase sigma-70 factor (ECF subfamily)
VIYLLFSEGYTASSGENNIKRDICYEAIRLALLLTKQKASDISETHALIALMCFHTSRFDARTDEKNELVDLEHQDRKKYDVELIRFGLSHFHKANEKPHKNPLYFLQAAVSFHYSDAANFDEINWENILKFYDLQLKYSPSPIIKLNSIVPFYKVHGPQKGLESLEEMNEENTLENNGLFHSIKAQLQQELQQFNEAKKSLKIAIELTYNEVQKKHLTKKLKNLN